MGCHPFEIFGSTTHSTQLHFGHLHSVHILPKPTRNFETSTEVEIFLPEESLFVTMLGVVVLGLMKHGSSSCGAYLIELFLVLSTVTVCCGGTYG